MDIKISKSGVLCIKRAGEFKEAICALDPNGSKCADYCAMFGEPIIQNNNYGILLLCLKEIVFKTCIDER